MVAVRGTGTPFPKAPFYLEVNPLGNRSGERWWLSFDDDILTLVDPDENPVLQLHRDEAARYIRLATDLFRGRTLTLAVAEGLREYSFRIGPESLSKLLSWLPQRPRAERLREVRKACAGVILFGVLHLLMQPYLAWQWGVPLLAIGVLGLLYPARAFYAANGAGLAMAGLWGLCPWYTPGIDPRAIPWEERLIPVAAGSLLIVWGIQQFSMLRSNQELRAARAIRDRRAAFVPRARDSRVVRRIGYAAAALAVLLGLYALVAGGWRAIQDAPADRNGVDPLLTDLIVACGVAVLAACSAAALLLRRRALYREARAAGQLVVASTVCALWAAAFSIAAWAQGGSVSFHGIVGANLAVFARPYVWVLAIAALLTFNRWFVRAVDRELEQLRD